MWQSKTKITRTFLENIHIFGNVNTKKERERERGGG
jgi:hypothetical protein